MVVACIALLVALAGTGAAAVAQLVPKNSVGTAQLKRNAVTSRKLAPNAVRSAHVADGSLLAVDFKPGQIPAGPKGDKGDKGEKGDKGDKGPRGPGATAFAVSKYIGSTDSNLTTIPNGLMVEGICNAGYVALGVKTTSGQLTLQVSGTYTLSGSVSAIRLNEGTSAYSILSSMPVDIDVIARDSSVGGFARIDAHGIYGKPCRFWGMVTPAS
jgi:hypothetical protein